MRMYWMTWAVLLFLTVAMLWMDGASGTIPRLFFVVFMVGAMLLKATLIGANFMHLRAERRGLVLTIVVGLLVTGAVLYVLILPDAVRIHDMVTAR
jgi:cytochrome c oxidase subunit IV